ncbi:MAG TPA: pirin family protein [Polyangia bacterium]|jgi:redox-sensitive bicupin YhaK (pirin superfamily)|nr:pirin family protein [Polyangia bacterium]
MTQTIRPVTRLVTAHAQTEGGGFVVRRPMPTPGFPLADPFLLIDEMGPVTYAPGEAIGAPDHPHRGFETVTYVLEGEMEHEDSAGHRGVLGPGDVQWMTAGAGIIHSEMPTKKVQERGGRVHGFQIWVNLPARLKMMQPRYQELSAARIPTAATEDGRARVRLVAGEALGVKAAIETQTPIVYQDWSLDDGGDVTVPLAPNQRALVYVFEGEVEVGHGSEDARRAKSGQLAVLGDGDAVRLRGVTGGGRLLLLAGVPLHEPVARYGPFVMNTADELETAFRDYQTGRMGEITRTAKIG